MEEKTKNEKIFETVLAVIGILCGVGTIVLATLFMVTKMKAALDYAEILLGVMMLLQGIRYFKKSKITAIVSFVVAVIIFTAAFFVMFV